MFGYVLCVFVLAVFVGRAFAEVIGVPPDMQSLYDGDSFVCDGGKVVPIGSVNDDYCDCLDGTDEPGTSACSSSEKLERTFYCRNRGFFPKTIFPSRVHDGVCDCCDGSDEPAGVCPDSCDELGRSILATSLESIRSLESSLAKRDEYVAKATRELTQKRLRREELNQRVEELEPLVADLRKKVDRIAKIESIDAAKRDSLVPPDFEDESDDDGSTMATEDGQVEEEKVTPSPKESIDEVADSIEASSFPEGVDHEGTCSDSSCDGASESRTKEELVLEAEDLAHQIEECRARIAERELRIGELEVDVGALEEQNHFAEMKNREGEQLLFLFDVFFAGFFSWVWRKMVYAFYSVLGVFYGGFDSAEAAVLRRDYSKYEAELDSARSEIAELETVLEMDYGRLVDDVFYALKDRCFSMKDKKKYEYEICPFGRASQKEGSSSVSLGDWDPFEDGEYDTFRFVDGQACWNGPKRSLTATVICGNEERLSKVTEQTMCKYSIQFETPAACTENQLADLREEVRILSG